MRHSAGCPPRLGRPSRVRHSREPALATHCRICGDPVTEEGTASSRATLGGRPGTRGHHLDLRATHLPGSPTVPPTRRSQYASPALREGHPGRGYGGAQQARSVVALEHDADRVCVRDPSTPHVWRRFWPRIHVPQHHVEAQPRILASSGSRHGHTLAAFVRAHPVLLPSWCARPTSNTGIQSTGCRKPPDNWSRDRR